MLPQSKVDKGLIIPTALIMNLTAKPCAIACTYVHGVNADEQHLQLFNRRKVLYPPCEGSGVGGVDSERARTLRKYLSG